MRPVWSIGLILAASLACGARTRAADPASQTFLVKAYGDHRIRLERVCDREQCTSLAFLELLSGDSPRQVAAAVEIDELTARSWAFVKDVEIVRLGQSYAFDLLAIDAQGAKPSFALRVKPGSGTAYQAQFRELDSLAAPD